MQNMESLILSFSSIVLTFMAYKDILTPRMSFVNLFKETKQMYTSLMLNTFIEMNNGLALSILSAPQIAPTDLFCEICNGLVTFLFEAPQTVT